MTHKRHYVGPPWPPREGAYDYARALCPTDFAWEFLRRDPRYQRDFQLNRKGLQFPRPVKTGLRVTRVRRRARGASAWGLYCFRRPGAAGPQCSYLLVREYCRSNFASYS